MESRPVSFPMIDAHHHLWDLAAVHYPWLAERGVARFFGDPTPIQRDYLLPEFRADAAAQGMRASVHIQVGAGDGLQEARWVEGVSHANPDWPLVQVAFCDLTRADLSDELDRLCALSSLRGLRQIVGRAAQEDAKSGTQALLDQPSFITGLQSLGARGLSFDLQLTPGLMSKAAKVFAQAPDTPVALCHAGSPQDRSTEGLAAWRKALAKMAALPQVSVKLSGLGMFDHAWTRQSFAPLVETCLELFGPARCMFGSNFPVDSLYSDYHRLFTTLFELVPPEARQAVFADTAARFYRLALPV